MWCGEVRGHCEWYWGVRDAFARGGFLASRGQAKRIPGLLVPMVLLKLFLLISVAALTMSLCHSLLLSLSPQVDTELREGGPV